MENVTDHRTDELQEQSAVEQPVNTDASENKSAAEANQPITQPTVSAAEESAPITAEASAPAIESDAAATEAVSSATEEAPAATDTADTSATSETAATDENAATDEPAKEKTYDIPDTKQGIVDRLTEIAKSGDAGSRSEQEALKQAFYKLQRDERAEEKAKFVANGGKEDDYQPAEDPLEEELKGQLSILKELRAQQIKDNDKLKEENLEKKKAIIEKIKAICTTPEEASKAYDTFKKLQAEWKEIKPIPESAANEIWKQFQFCQDQFYDLLKTNSALRDYDFKKNLEAKTQLCEAAEKLADNPDIISAFHQLQQLHLQFREIGPVAKEVREDLWNRFKTASSVINKRHAQYFEGLKEKEEENLKKKTEICEEIEAIDVDKLQGYAQWDGVTKQILALQERWKTIGRATKKMNSKIFDRFRAACDNFFQKKAAFFKEQKKVYADNAARKLALVEKAEALKDSTQWTATTQELVKLQKEWREIGTTAHKTSNALWERFNAACNEFFNKKKAVLGDQHKEETENLNKKNTVIEKLEALAIEGGENIAEAVRALQEEWNNIGHVPYKSKDKLFARYRETLDKLNKEFNLHLFSRQGRGQRRENARPMPEGNALIRLYEARKAELATYENNISFLTSSSKKGSALIDNMQKKIESLKANLADLANRINNPQPAQDEQKADTETTATKPAENASEPTVSAAESSAPATETAAPASEPAPQIDSATNSTSETPVADAPAPADSPADTDTTAGSPAEAEPKAEA